MTHLKFEYRRILFRSLARPIGSICMTLGVAVVSFSILASALAAPAIKQGGTLVVTLNENPSTLIGGLTTDITTSVFSGQLFDTLIKLDSNYSIFPSLALSWERSDDGISYTFHLRKDVKWHDGAPFTSADVKYSFEQIDGKYNTLAMFAFQSIAEIRTPDPYTVVFVLKAADPAFFPWSIGQASAQIYPKHIYEGTDPTTNKANFKPVGTGPFVFKEWARGSHITLERNPDYFDKEHLYLDRLVFQIIPEASARQLALERGDVDLLPYVSVPATAVESLKANKEIEIVDLPKPGQSQIIAFFNLRGGPLSKKDVRHAIAFGVDRQRIIALALNGRGKIPTGPINSANGYYTSDVSQYSRDVEKAKALLDAAGYPMGASGNRFNLRIIYQASGEGGSLQSAAEILREQLREVGINIVLQPADPATFQDNAFIKWDFDIALGSFATGPDPKIGVARFYLTEFIVPRNSANLMAYSNPAVDDLFNKAANEVNDTKRSALYHDVQKLVAEDLPALWLWEKSYPIAFRKGIVGLPSGAEHTEAFVNVGWAAK